MSSYRIMIAEDDPAIVEAMQLILEDAGYDVVVATHGQAVLEMLSDLPAVLLLDIWLAGVNGKVLCQHLKQDQQTKNMPIILCSANRDIEEIARDAGADDYLVKPFDIDALLDKVAAHLSADE